MQQEGDKTEHDPHELFDCELPDEVACRQEGSALDPQLRIRLLAALQQLRRRPGCRQLVAMRDALHSGGTAMKFGRVVCTAFCSGTAQ